MKLQRRIYSIWYFEFNHSVQRAFYFVQTVRSSLLIEIRDFSRADRGGSPLINSGRKPNMGIRGPYTLVNKESRAIN